MKSLRVLVAKVYSSRAIPDYYSLLYKTIVAKVANEIRDEDHAGNSEVEVVGKLWLNDTILNPNYIGVNYSLIVLEGGGRGHFELNWNFRDFSWQR